MRRIYQMKNKEEFLKQKPEGDMREKYKWLFEKSFKHESKNSRDIFDFNKRQLLEFYKDRESSIDTLTVYNNMIKKYTDFTIDNGIKFGKNNTAAEITRKDLESVETTKFSVLKPEKVFGIIEHPTQDKEFTMGGLRNIQDMLLVYLPFLGVYGNKYSELINLKYDNIDFKNNIIKLSELDPERKDIKVDDYCIMLLEKSKYEEHYDSYSHDESEREARRKLESSEYVFRKIVAGKYDMDNDPRLEQGTLLNRFRTLSAYTGEKLTAKRLERAGMIYFGKQVMDNGFEFIAKDEITRRGIFDRYNITNEQARYRLPKKIKDDIQELYKID